MIINLFYILWTCDETKTLLFNGAFIILVFEWGLLKKKESLQIYQLNIIPLTGREERTRTGY